VRRGVGLTMALILALVALASVRIWAAHSHPIPTEPGLATAAVAARGLEQTPPMQPGTRVAVVGDSVADTVSWGFVPAARGRGLDASAIVVSGCGMIRGPVVADDGSIVPWSPGCERRLATQTIPDMVARGADVYLWLSSWDAAPHLVDGVTYDARSAAGRAGLAGLVRETADQIAPPGSGRHIVFLSPALPTTSEKGVPSASKIRDTYAHQSMLREVVRSDPSRFSLVRLDRVLCPSATPPCPVTFADGVTPRPADGGHFDRAGSDWFAPQLLDLLGVPA